MLFAHPNPFAHCCHVISFDFPLISIIWQWIQTVRPIVFKKKATYRMYLYYYSLLLWTICISYIGFVRIDGLIGCFMISGHIQRYLSFSKSDYFKYVFIIHGIYYFLKTKKVIK